MSISVTKNQQNNFNPLKWATYGAIGGYVAKDVLPLTKAEKEHYQFEQFVTDRKASVKNAVDQELKAVKDIIANGTKDQGYDLYLKYVEIGKKQPDRSDFLKALKNQPDNVVATFQRLRSQVDEKVRELKKSHNFMYEAAVKKLRPAAGYIFVGALISTGAAFVTHVLSKMSSTQS